MIEIFEPTVNGIIGLQLEQIKAFHKMPSVGSRRIRVGTKKEYVAMFPLMTSSILLPWVGSQRFPMFARRWTEHLLLVLIQLQDIQFHCWIHSKTRLLTVRRKETGLANPNTGLM